MHAPEKTLTTALATVKGQVEAILRMVEADRYCVDISKQILSAQSQLRKINLMILDGHIRHCVTQAAREGNETEKINEVMEIIEKYSR